jgi:hypothetical protein
MRFEEMTGLPARDHKDRWNELIDNLCQGDV